MKKFNLLFTLGLSLSLTVVLAHKPFFPQGEGPFSIATPTVSQAHYLQFDVGKAHVFKVPILERRVPVQVLVLDDELGRSLDIDAYWHCGETRTKLTNLDQPFYEGFSKLEHRYRVVDTIGPTTEPCEVHIYERSRQLAPYTFSIGVEEKFSLGDVIGLFSLGEKLKAWQRVAD